MVISILLYVFSLFAGDIPGKISHVVRTTQMGQGTVFWAEGDVDNPPGNYCFRRARKISRYLKDTELVVAHNTLPCGSLVMVFNLRTRKQVVAKVVDRGPRNGIVDLSRATARAVKLNGKETVIVIPLLE